MHYLTDKLWFPNPDEATADGIRGRGAEAAGDLA